MKRLFIFLGLVLAFLAIVYTSWWFYMADQFKENFTNYVRSAEEKNIIIDHENLQVSGFPLSLRASLDNFSIQSSIVHFSAPQFLIEVSPWNMRRVLLPQMQNYSFESLGKHNEKTTLTFSNGKGIFDLDSQGHLKQLDLALDQLSLSAEAERHKALLHVNQLTMATSRDAVVDVSSDKKYFTLNTTADMVALTLPTVPALAEGILFNKITLKGKISEPVPDFENRASLEEWQKNAGEILLEDLTLATSKGFSIKAQGNGSLDAQLRPLAELSFEVQGLDDVIDQMSKNPGPLAQQALILKLAMLALPKEKNAEGREVIKLPLKMHEGVLFLLDQPFLQLNNTASQPTP